jgi:DNA-binding CsgD family transcriptional regulator
LPVWDDVDVSEGPGAASSAVEGRVGAGFAAIAAGDWPGARDAFSAVLEVAEVPEAFFGLANVLFWLGDLAGTIASCEKAYAGFRRRGDAMLAAGALQQGEPSAAAAVLRRRLAATSPDRLDVAAVIELFGEAEIALHDSGAAIERGRALIALGAVNNCDLIVAHGERLLGHALAATDVPAACAHLETALAAFVHAGIPYRAAQTRLLLAQVLGHGDREVAGAEARAALSAFEDLGAGRDADAAAALMRDLGIKAARTGPKNVGRLTRREQEVLALLGEGLSNPEIAGRLFLSRKTVEHHVARILSKLGLRGRAEAAALAARGTPERSAGDR